MVAPRVFRSVVDFGGGAAAGHDHVALQGDGAARREEVHQIREILSGHHATDSGAGVQFALHVGCRHALRRRPPPARQC